MTPDELLLRAALRQEAAAEGRMGMRARIAGADSRHFELDQSYYQERSEGRPARYPETEHEAIERDLGASPQKIAGWPVGPYASDRSAYGVYDAEAMVTDCVRALPPGRAAQELTRDLAITRDTGRVM
ncbi:MAG: hypothetical protein ACRDZO_15135 [Egibacteraceae bacterium]